MLAAQRRIEVLVQEVKRALISPLENNLDRVLQINAHLVRFKVFLGPLTKTVLGALRLGLETEYAIGGWSTQRGG